MVCKPGEDGEGIIFCQGPYLGMVIASGYEFQWRRWKVAILRRRSNGISVDSPESELSNGVFLVFRGIPHAESEPVFAAANIRWV